MSTIKQLVRKVEDSNGFLYACFVENGAKRTIKIGGGQHEPN